VRLCALDLRALPEFTGCSAVLILFVAEGGDCLNNNLRHTDPRTTRRYDQSQHKLDLHPAYVAGGPSSGTNGPERVGSPHPWPDCRC